MVKITPNLIDYSSSAIKETYKHLGNDVEAYVRQKQAEKDMLQYMPKPVRILNKMKKMLGGESTNICINALGTGLIAPIFIKYNFLSKTDSDTRTYSAWRQPVSAVLSVATQVGMLIPINRWINKLSNEGRLLGFDMLNQGGYQNEAYLTKRIKKANPAATKEEIKKLVSKAQNNQLQQLVTAIKNDNTIKFINKSGKEVAMSPEKYKELVKAVFEEKENKIAKEIEKLKASTVSEDVKKLNALQIKQNALSNIKNDFESGKPIGEIVKGLKKENPFKNSMVMDIVQKYTGNVQKNMKGFGALSGLLISFAILPLSCELLNDLYPKFMDTFFPELSKKKGKNKETKKGVEA